MQTKEEKKMGNPQNGARRRWNTKRAESAVRTQLLCCGLFIACPCHVAFSFLFFFVSLISITIKVSRWKNARAYTERMRDVTVEWDSSAKGRYSHKCAAIRIMIMTLIRAMMIYLLRIGFTSFQ